MNNLRSHHARFTRATLDKRTDSRMNPRYSFGLQTVNLLGPEPRAALDHSNSEQNSVKATDIRTNATDVETRKNIV